MLAQVQENLYLCGGLHINRLISMYRLTINISGANTRKFYRLFDLPYREPRVTDNMLSLMLLRRARLSSLTTMPRTFRVFGETCPSYEQWLCDRLNRPVSRVIYYPGKLGIMELEEKARPLMKGEKRPLRTVYSIYRENATAALEYTRRHHGVGTAQQWMDENLGGLQDQPFTGCSVITLNRETENTMITLTADTRDDLSAWFSNVMKWLKSEGITCSARGKVIDNQAAGAR